MAVVQACGDEGYDEATLWVLESNVRARGFYATHGWAADGGAEAVDGAAGPARKLRYRRPVAR